MQPRAETPPILREAITSNGVALQVRHDVTGVLDVPGFDRTLIAFHIGAPAKLSCRRDGRHHAGTAVHGDIDIIPERTPSRWEMHDDNDNALLLILPPALMENVARDCGMEMVGMEIRNRFQIRDAELEMLGWAMKREVEMGCPSGRLYLDGLALAVAARVVARHSSASPRQSGASEGLAGHRLKQVLSYIEERLEEDLSLTEIAGVAGISASHLNTQFRMSMGMPVHQYLIQRRVERAKALMMRDGLSMAEIAQSAGFAHQSHMARHMRRVLGLPPRELRRALSGNSNSH